MLHKRQHYTIDQLRKRWGRTKEQIEGYLKTKALKATTWQGIVDLEESNEIHWKGDGTYTCMPKTPLLVPRLLGASRMISLSTLQGLSLS